MLLLSAKGGALAERIGPRWPMTIGPIVAGTGIALLCRLNAGTDYLTGVLPAVLVFALGMALTVAPLTPRCWPPRRTTRRASRQP